MQFCDKCGSLVQDGICSNPRCSSRDEALTSWIINGVLWRCKVPLTREQAEKAVKDKSPMIIKYRPPKDSFIKP